MEKHKCKSERVEHNAANDYYIAQPLRNVKEAPKSYLQHQLNDDRKRIKSATVKQETQRASQPFPNFELECNACGEVGHFTGDCRYYTRLCFYCRQEGHIVRICPKRKRARERSSRTHRNGSVYHPVAIRKARNVTHAKQKQPRHHATVAHKRTHPNGEEYAYHLPPGVRCKSRAPVGTVIAIGTVEDFADDDTLQRRNSNGCNDIIFHILCCCL
uniref:CCHC-type domain-containing protein n=1 Tax=Anopheles maculatus TaxID=74869 RepID=A0A182SR48_9DIPT